MKKWIVPFILLAVAAGSLGACFALDAPHIEFDRAFYADLVAEYGEPAPANPISAVYRSRIFHRAGIPVEVAVEPVLSSELGEHTVHYSAAYRSAAAAGSYQVLVVDTVPPELTVDEDTLTCLCVDNHDGDLTDRVEREELPDSIVFTVADSSGNRAERVVPRIVEPDVTPPVIELGAGLLDYACFDETDGDLTDRVRYYESGGYLYYEAEDSSGNTAAESRRIAGSDKVVYLTFDDGPGPYTEKLLDVLAQHDVRATFFVVGKSKYLDLLPRMAAEGHAIGAHTYSHVYSEVYASADAYFADLDRVLQRIVEQLGTDTQLVRFPGGGSNTVSRNYCKGIMTELSGLLPERGYVYFDWNVSGGDTSAGANTDSVIANVKNGISQHSVSVVLQHDVKEFSVDAVDAIIRWGKANGYVFLPLTERSTTAHHGISN